MKVFLSVLPLCFLLSASCLLTGQTSTVAISSKLDYASPEAEGVSSERLDRISEMCRTAISEKQVPGIVALVCRNGRIVFHEAFGSANSQGTSLDKDAVFRIASQSKAITSTAVMMLWEEGRFQLDDPISKYIPEFSNPQVLSSFRYSDTSYTTVPSDREITIRHLLTHTSGLGYGVIDGDERFQMLYKKAGITDLFTTESIAIKESVLKLAKLPLHHHPGTRYTYSEGLDVLGYFIEVITGMSFDQYLRKHLFDPLGMHDTYFYLPDEKAARLVEVQMMKNNTWQKYPNTFYDTEYPIKGAKTFFSGGAGLSSTARDYATFLQMYLNGGHLDGVRILSRTTVEAILSNQIGHLDNRDYGLAFGLNDAGEAAKGGRGSEGTFDWGGYFNTQYFADPKERMIGILMKQTRGPVNDQTGWKFRILVSQSVDD